MRKFALHRLEDVSGVSGTGVVAEGVQLRSGRCVLEWRDNPATLGPVQYPTIGLYDNIQALEAIHGHGGSTVVVWGWEEDY